MKPIDFAGRFRLAALEQLRGRQEMNEEEADAFAHAFYHQWMETPQEWLEGQTPSEYFKQFSDPGELIGLMGKYFAKNWEIPEPLLDQIAMLSRENFLPLLEAIRDERNSDALRAMLLGLLSNLECPETDEICEKVVFHAVGESELSEIAVEILSYGSGEAVRERLVERYPEANDYAQMLILDVLCNYPGDPRVYSYCMERIFADSENRSLYANYLVKLGDERAVEPLKRLLGLSEIGYLDYLELRNAVEALGGDPGEERTFYGDPDYEAMRNL